MFHAKLAEIDAQTQQLAVMRGLLTEALNCDCLHLDRAALVPAALGWATDTASATRVDATGHGRARQSGPPM